MGFPAARVGDMHLCPMVTPGVPPIPHVGGPVLPAGCPTVLIGKMPAARMGDMCLCVGPPDSIAKGSAGVMIGKMPAARMTVDMTIHGGMITLGCPTVLIGEVMPGPPLVVVPPIIIVNLVQEQVQAKTTPPHPLQKSVLKNAAKSGKGFCEICAKMAAAKKKQQQQQQQAQSPLTNTNKGAQKVGLKAASQQGTPFCEVCEQKKKEKQQQEEQSGKI